MKIALRCVWCSYPHPRGFASAPGGGYGSVRLAIIRALGLEEPLLAVVRWIDRQLRRWPWLYWKLAADCEWGYTGSERNLCACPICAALEGDTP